MHSVQISYLTHFDACCLQLENAVCTERNAGAWSREGQRATYFDSERDAGRLSTFSFLGQKRDEESARLFKLSSGCNAQMGRVSVPCTLVFRLSLHSQIVQESSVY